MDPNQSGLMARIAMRHGNYPEALRHLSMALRHIPPQLTQFGAPLLADRAECFWQLGHAEEAVQDIMDAFSIGLPRDAVNSEEEAGKWTRRGVSLYLDHNYFLAERCTTVALYFRVDNPFFKAQSFLNRALSRFELGNISGTQSDAQEVKRLDKHFARASAQKQKDEAMEEFKRHSYEKAVKLFQLCLLLHPEDGSGVKFRRSVQSHQATAYFHLNNHRKALEVGVKSCNSNPTFKSKDEAERWKDRGNRLSKVPNSLDLAIDCYSLALKYADEKDLIATILSNRSLMYKNTERYEEALCDAQRCVENNPNWEKAQYRLGSCLFARERYSEALEPFSRSLKLLLNNPLSKEHRKVDTLNQVLSVAQKHPGGTCGIQYDVPRRLIQTAVDKAVVDKDWQRLHLLFMGGGGEKRFQKGSGGLGTGCDASSVPLEEVIHCDFKDLTDFISVLLDHKASSDPPKGRENPVDVAIQLDKFDVVNVLMDRCKKTEPSQETSSTSKGHKRTFKTDGLEAISKRDNKKAIELLQLSLKHEKSNVGEQRKTLKHLCELYFGETSFKECLATGEKLKATYWGEKGEDNDSFRIVLANQWKKWGNELHKESKFELMAQFYSLALEFTPLSNKEIMTALLCNRCLAFIKLKKFKDALADAEECIKIRPDWFRGHSRQGTCLCHLKRKKEALAAFCKAHTCALNEKEENATAYDVISTAMNVEGGENRITCNLSLRSLQYLVKEATVKNEWKKLRFLYLGSAASKAARGVCFECDASCVPLDLLIESNVEDLHNLVPLLLRRGALPNGLKECKRPPLLVAMEMRKFPLAVILLRNQADPSCIVGHGIFINKEGQPKQWLHLGRKAVESSNHKKAVMLLNMCIHLSDPGQDLSILTAAYQALAEAFFKLEEHEQSVNAGKECFKLRPHKSEDEAKHWQFRASHVFTLGQYKSCIECVNLALKYTPADSTGIFSRLLSQRSEVEQQLGEYTSGLEDAKKASMMTADMLEGYLNQFRCLRALNRRSEALQAINECLKRTIDETLLSDLLNNALTIAGGLEERTSALTNPIPRNLLINLLNDVIKKKDWHKLKILYLGGGGPSFCPVGAGGLATNIDTANVPLGEVIHHLGLEEPLLISVLIENGASVNAVEGSDVIPLNEAMEKDQLPLVETLVKNGANCCAADSEGEPVIHKALRKGLKSGDFGFLKSMLKSKNPEMENVRDARDDTLYHLVCAGRKPNKKSYDRKCDAIRLLRAANVNPNLPNKRGLRPLEMVTKNDSRWKMISTFIESYNSKAHAPSFPETHPENAFQEEQHKAKTVVATEDDDRSVASEPKVNQEEETSIPTKVKESSKPDDKEKRRIRLRQNIDVLIESLSPLVSVPTVETEEQEDSDILDESVPIPDITGNEETPKDHTFEASTTSAYRQTDATEQEITDDEVEAEIDFKTPFEDLPWEVDCTDRVWKVMRSKKVDNNMRKRIIEKVQMLANGRWSKTLCKRLEGEPKKHGIHLYESKLTKGQRILWEETIAFSGRLSDLPENRLNEETSEGRIYSDIIRVWDIVLDHDKLEHSIKHIVKSHDRGMHCLIEKKLKGLPAESQNANAPSGERLPNKYVDRNIPTQSINKKNIPKKTHLSENLSQMFFPPASPNEQEYHILKFYSFNTPLVKTVLESDTSTKIDFPFKITELEHAIVNLRPNPPTPIILLGRSGTGKTTCCLYRLWDNFQGYWERAATAGPHIPRYVRPGEAWGSDSKVESPPSSTDQDGCGIDSRPLATKCNEYEDCQDLEKYDMCRSSYFHHFEDDVPANSNGPCMYEHLHQIFVTKNTVLCSEVEKNFKELCRACPAAEQRLQFEDRSTAKKIQDVSEEEWPLFLNSKNWLLILDASLPGERFFKRAEDGTLERKIEGWEEEDNHLQFIPVFESDGESDEEEDEEVTEIEDDNKRPKDKGKGPKENRDPRREITYHVFQHEIWPKMKKTSKEKVQYHPTLVWTEIRSFIKGSAEALMTENGFLSLEDYESLGKKKAPNFSADRKVVYDLFVVYQQQRLRDRMFDEADLVFNIHRRLQSNPVPEWSIHQFYVDETQDFTQAELSLLIRCCRFPNQLFFTGDTAQSIMRGIAFRFDDLKTLFHHAKKAAAIKEGHHNFIRVPKKLYQLTHNYRSHAGILRLASSVVDLLLHYFPNSFDRLKKDEGLFEGPKPVLLEACTPTDLALILQGNQRQSSRIEFGAHQVVLVVSNEARDAMPDELKQGLVMTIYEAKGLEFDDVLIYNFFKDSQAGKEWRVVTSFMEQQNVADASSSTGLTEITEESVQMKHSRPLEFNREKHKVLNSEFKYLYTAITRARVNVWFFDEDEEARAPVFEYFRRLKLVNVVKLEDQGKGTGQLASMFAVKSTPEEWRKGGIRFYKNRLWVAAIQCFTFAGDMVMLQKSQAQQLAEEAIKFRSTNRQMMRDEFLRAGESFLQCEMYDKAAICLNNAREWTLLAKLYEKIGKHRDAARLFKKKGLLQEASRCFESQNDYRDAIEILCSAGRIEEALSAMERFKILSSSVDLEGRQGIIPPKDTRTVERMRYQLADKHFKEGNKEKMEEVLQHLPSTNDRITFLRKRGCVIEAARAMGEEGRRNEAASLLRNEGMFEEAVKYSSDPKFTADCLLLQARTTMNTNDTQAILRMALAQYQKCQNHRGQAEALLMLGQLSNDVEKIQDASKLFFMCKNFHGQAESVAELLRATHSPPETSIQQDIIQALERLLGLITLLYQPAGQHSMAKRKEVQICEEHFGLFTTDSEQTRVYYCKRGGRFSRVDPQFIERNSSKSEATIETTDARQKIGKFLIGFSVTFADMIKKMLENTLLRNSVCRKETDGSSCDNPASCEYQHEDSEELFYNRFHTLLNFVYLNSVVKQFVFEMTRNKNGIDVIPLGFKRFVENHQEFDACQQFYNFLFPPSGYRRYLIKGHHLSNVTEIEAVKRRISQFAGFLWKETTKERRRADTDNFLKVSSSLQLIGSSPVMLKWICEEENQFKREKRKLFNTTRDDLVRNGMVQKKKTGAYESYLHWWEVGKKKLYVSGDVENAAHEIIRSFLTLTAKRSGMIYPSIANTVMIIEYQLTACLALYANLCTHHRYPICLPESYLVMVRFWDNVRPNVNKGTFTLYKAVEHNARQERNKVRLLKATCRILDYMVRLTCGDIASRFDVLGDALSSDDIPTHSTSGEAERSLVLFLTMLCNCGKGISTSVEGIMLKNIFSLKPNPRLPNRIKNAVMEVQEAKGLCDVVAVFDKFLQSRGERLYDLRWHNGKLWFDGSDGPSNPNNYRKRFYTDTSNIGEELGKMLVETPHCGEAVGEDKEDSGDVDFDATEEDIEVKYTEEDLREKENARSEVAATKIQRWYRGVKQVKEIPARNLERLKSIEEQSKASTSTVEERFSKFKLDSSACGICGVHFASLDDYQEEYDGALPDKQVENVEDHRKSYAHCQKEEQFQQYKEIYLAKIHPCLVKEKELRNMIDDISSSGDKRGTEHVALDLERLETNLSLVKKDVQTIETLLEWENTGSLLKEAKKLGASLKGLFKLLEQAKTDLVMDETMTGHDETEDQDDKLGEDEGEDSFMDMHMDVPKKRRKGKRKKRSQATDTTAFP